VKLWGDFGFCVTLIGVGYSLVAFDLSNRAIVWLGIGAKAFDVIVLPSRWLSGITKPVVLLPAAIDALFILGFVWFLIHNVQNSVREASKGYARPLPTANDQNARG
jgi:hypothetical protein